MRNMNKNIKKFIFLLIVSVITFIWLVPVLMAIFNGLKNMNEIMNNPNGIPSVAHFENYITVFIRGKYDVGFRNSFLIAGISTLLIIIVCSSIAFPLNRLKNKTNKFISTYLLVGLMVPAGLTMIPTYKLLQTLHLINKPYGLIFLHIAYNTPFVVFLYTGFMKSIPKELDEAARIDGCNVYRLYWKIIFPLLKPVTATVIILIFTLIFNDFFNNLVFASNIKTVSLALYDFKGLYFTEWNMIFAGVTIAMILPITIFLLFQKYFERGLIAGAIKG